MSYNKMSKEELLKVIVKLEENLEWTSHELEESLKRVDELECKEVSAYPKTYTERKVDEICKELKSKNMPLLNHL